MDKSSTYLLLVFFGILVLYIIYNRNKNVSDDKEEFGDTENIDDIDDTHIDKLICKCQCHYKKGIKHIRPCCDSNRKINLEKNDSDVFPTGKSFLINPKTGLNKFGCNCVCHGGRHVDHLAPCCGIKEVCGCPCHNGINIDHNTKCCDQAIIQ